MQIAVFIKRTTLHPTFGGLETQNKLLCEGLVSRGHTVTIFSPKLGALTPPLVLAENLTFIMPPGI